MSLIRREISLITPPLSLGIMFRPLFSLNVPPHTNRITHYTLFSPLRGLFLNYSVDDYFTVDRGVEGNRKVINFWGWFRLYLGPICMALDNCSAVALQTALKKEPNSVQNIVIEAWFAIHFGRMWSPSVLLMGNSKAVSLQPQISFWKKADASASYSSYYWIKW